MKLKAFVTLTIRDSATGRVIKRRRFPSRSYVRAMMDILFAQMRRIDTLIPDTTGANISVNYTANNFYSAGAIASTVDGIVIGTGTTAVAISDYALQTLIAHGTTPGKMQYQAQSHTVPATIGNTRRFIIIRSFVNTSLSAITVNEAALYVWGTATPKYFCIARDLISGGVLVQDGQTLTIQYTISVTA